MEISLAEKKSLLLLAGMNGGNEGTWNKEKAELYLLVLRRLGPVAGRAAVERAIESEAWRPAPSRLREIAADLFSPLPPVGVLWSEFRHKAITVGYETPRWTHPILAEIARDLGGWQTQRGKHYPSDEAPTILAAQREFQRVFADCQKAWREKVLDALPAQAALPPAQRVPALFPTLCVWQEPKRLPPEASGDLRLIEAPSERPAVPLPAIFARAKAKIGQPMPEPPRRIVRPEERETRQRIEAELTSLRNRNRPQEHEAEK